MNNKASNSNTNTPTALASWMRGLARELELQGCQPAPLFEQAGLDIALLESPEARYPVPQTTLLWQKAVQATGDETLGIKAIRHITPATFHAASVPARARVPMKLNLGCGGDKRAHDGLLAVARRETSRGSSDTFVYGGSDSSA